MRILISRLSSLGDVVCSLPVAVGLKRTYPDSQITWACQEPFADIVRMCPDIDQTVSIGEGNRHDRSAIRRLGLFDLAVDLQGIWKSGALIGASRSRRKLGFHWQRELSWLFCERVLPDPSSLHVVDQYADVARAAGAEIDQADFGLALDPTATATLEATLAGVGVSPDEPLVGFSVASKWHAKDWAVRNYVEAARAAIATGARVVVLGPSVTKASSWFVSQLSPAAIDLGGKTTIPEVASLLARCRAHVGGDTGPSHLAAALGRPAISVFLTTDARRSCPYGQIQNCVPPDPSAVAARLCEVLEAK